LTKYNSVYAFHFLKDIFFPFDFGLQLLRPMYELFLKLLLEIVFCFVPDDEGAIDLGDDVGLLPGK
jgi:hypothetical protein